MACWVDGDMKRVATRVATIEERFKEISEEEKLLKRERTALEEELQVISTTLSGVVAEAGVLLNNHE